jgi:cephalosporin hydroxylase
MDMVNEFKEERRKAIDEMSKDEALKKKSLDWMIHADKYKYSYNFSWLGRPIIKYPNDMVLMQEAIWDIKPDLIIETGIAHGGSLIFSASMLELIGGEGEVVGIDIDIRAHNRKEIEKHPMFKRITMIEASSVSDETLAKVKAIASKKKVMIFLDSLHTHEHALKELELYSPLVSVGSYIVLPDTFIEFFPKGYFHNRPWDVGNNPATAIKAFLAKNKNFVLDNERDKKLMISESLGGGYLKRIK